MASTEGSHSPDRSLRPVIIGLAGHTDHGKSALVQQLTGGRTDARPEEQRRGMTVDLGFSHFDAAPWRFAVIDVPGHDRFVHNMVHGAAGIDFGMLVVAADDSVMPQTREHLEILDLLQVPGGIVVITKTDTVDATQVEWVREDIGELVDGTTFERSPVVAVSNVDGSGIPELRQALVALAEHHRPAHDLSGPFRLSIDRAFSLPGHGTIVTGTVRRGTLSTADRVQLLPQDRAVKVRELQRQGSTSGDVGAGERAAINLAGVRIAEVARGDELVEPGHYQTSRRLIIQLDLLPHRDHGIADRELVRLHLGTREVTARVRMAGRDAQPGESCIALIDCQAAVVGEYGQRLILRRLSPATTIAGGRILALSSPRQRVRDALTIAAGLAADDLQTRLPALLQLTGPIAPEWISWPVVLGVTRSQVDDCCRSLFASGVLVEVPGNTTRLLAGAEWNRLLQQMTQYCEEETRNRHPVRWIDRAQVIQRFTRRYEAFLVDHALGELVRQDVLQARERTVALVRGLRLSSRQQQLRDLLLEHIVAGGMTPPLLKELAEQHEQSIGDLVPLIDRLVDDGWLVRITDDLCVSPQVLQQLQDSLRVLFSSQTSLSVAECRDRWQVTRKFALPYLQYFDEQGWTQRSGTVRVAGQQLHDQPTENAAS